VHPDAWELNHRATQAQTADALQRARAERAKQQLLREQVRIASAALELQLRRELEQRAAWQWRSPRLLNVV